MKCHHFAEREAKRKRREELASYFENLLSKAKEEKMPEPDPLDWRGILGGVAIGAFLLFCVLVVVFGTRS